MLMKYIIFDLDDTLLNKEKEITPFSYNVLKKYQANGNPIIINTAQINATKSISPSY